MGKIFAKPRDMNLYIHTYTRTICTAVFSRINVPITVIYVCNNTPNTDRINI